MKFSINKEHEYVVTDQRGLRQQNKNYLFVKRFTAKEERRRLQCGVYLPKKYPQFDVISTQNKINFIDGLATEINAMPDKQQADLCCYVLLAMANVRETDAWMFATNEWIRIHDIIQFVGANYGMAYAENSRETIRKQALHHFRTAAFQEFTFSSGKHNELQKAIIEEFAPRFTPNSECLYVGDTIEKDLR